MHIKHILLIALAALIVTACGVKGPPLPPETRAVDVSTGEVEGKEKEK